MLYNKKKTLVMMGESLQKNKIFEWPVSVVIKYVLIKFHYPHYLDLLWSEDVFFLPFISNFLFVSRSLITFFIWGLNMYKRSEYLLMFFFVHPWISGSSQVLTFSTRYLFKKLLWYILVKLFVRKEGELVEL